MECENTAQYMNEITVAIISSGSSSYSIYNNTNETMQTKSHC